MKQESSQMRGKVLPENTEDYTSYFTPILEIRGVYQPENRAGAAPSRSHIVAFLQLSIFSSKALIFYIPFKNGDFLILIVTPKRRPWSVASWEV